MAAIHQRMVDLDGRFQGLITKMFTIMDADLADKCFRLPGIVTVSYTHLDVYKRQKVYHSRKATAPLMASKANPPMARVRWRSS